MFVPFKDWMNKVDSEEEKEEEKDENKEEKVQYDPQVEDLNWWCSLSLVVFIFLSISHTLSLFLSLSS